MNGFIPVKREEPAPLCRASAALKAPVKVDWRAKGYVPPVKSQVGTGWEPSQGCGIWAAELSSTSELLPVLAAGPMAPYPRGPFVPWPQSLLSRRLPVPLSLCPCCPLMSPCPPVPPPSPQVWPARAPAHTQHGRHAAAAALAPPGRHSPRFLSKMAAPSGRSGGRSWAALVPAALLCLAARAAAEPGTAPGTAPSTAEFDVRPGGEVHSFSRSLVSGREGGNGFGEGTRPALIGCAPRHSYILLRGLAGREGGRGERVRGGPRGKGGPKGGCKAGGVRRERGC